MAEAAAIAVEISLAPDQSPLSLAAALGFELGLTPKQIEAGVANTMPYEHRMQPYVLAGAWIIDDTYNGNIEGIRAAIIDKDRNPRWRPEKIEAVTQEIVDRHFRSLSEQELTFE